jgi:hypothetical protein
MLAASYSFISAFGSIAHTGLQFLLALAGQVGGGVSSG